MHKTVIGGLAALMLTAEAHAGDLAYAPVPYPYWCGPYIGANLGFQYGSISSSGAKPSGVTGGFQGGYLWQFGQWVSGWESDFQFSSAEDSFSFYKFANPWWGTARWRAGIAFDNVLLYGTLGLAYGRTRIDVANLSETNFHVGGTFGAGVEFALARNWSVKAEYLRVDLASQHFTLTGGDHGLSSNVVRIGINYHF
jgi:outer membrane immunogenic protein